MGLFYDWGYEYVASSLTGRGGLTNFIYCVGRFSTFFGVRDRQLFTGGILAYAGDYSYGLDVGLIEGERYGYIGVIAYGGLIVVLTCVECTMLDDTLLYDFEVGITGYGYGYAFYEDGALGVYI